MGRNCTEWAVQCAALQPLFARRRSVPNGSAIRTALRVPGCVSRRASRCATMASTVLDCVRVGKRAGTHTVHYGIRFASGADGWLVAFAAVHGSIVVTNEQSAPASRQSIKLPDVCSQFGVAYVDTFRMLQRLAVKFVFEDS